MKSQLKILALSLMAFCLIFSCSSDDGRTPEGPSITSITLSASSSSSSVGDPITFTVTTNTGQNVTSSSDIQVDNSSISGNSFSPSQAGSYSVKASYNSLTSNTVNVTFTPTYQSITLTVSETQVEVGNSFTVSVTADNGDNVTSSASILVNDSQISGTSYTPTDEGDYVVSASLGTLSSNSETVNAFYGPVTSLSLEASDNNAFWDEDVTLTVIDNYGRDLTSQATFFANGTELSSNIVTSSIDASFDCTATFESVTSNVTTVSFSEPPPFYKKNVLVEDFTGTWCQFCPRVSWAIELLEAETEDIVVAAIHVNDEMDRINSNSLENLVGVDGYPAARYDRINVWEFPESENLDQITSRAGRAESLGLSVESSLDGNTINTGVKVAFTSDYSHELDLVVYLIEDGLLYDQINFYDNLYGGQNPIPDFEHNGVVSHVFTNILGDLIPGSETFGGNEYARDFSITVPSEIENTANLQIAAFVINGLTDEVINARQGPIGTLADFEIAE